MEALRRLATVFDAYEAKTQSRPVLVGGAAASIYTGGTITSGDFDVVAAADDIFDRAMADHGFRQEDRAGHLLIGYYHPAIPTIGVQLVSGRLFEGRTDSQRITLLPIEESGTIALAPVEDMIADRLGQYAASNDGDDDMLEQAHLLFKLAGEIDREYLTSGQNLTLGSQGQRAGVDPLRVCPVPSCCSRSCLRVLGQSAGFSHTTTLATTLNRPARV